MTDSPSNPQSTAEVKRVSSKSWRWRIVKYMVKPDDRPVSVCKYYFCLATSPLWAVLMAVLFLIFCVCFPVIWIGIKFDHWRFNHPHSFSCPWGYIEEIAEPEAVDVE